MTHLPAANPCCVNPNKGKTGILYQTKPPSRMPPLNLELVNLVGNELVALKMGSVARQGEQDVRVNPGLAEQKLFLWLPDAWLLRIMKQLVWSSA